MPPISALKSRLIDRLKKIYHSSPHIVITTYSWMHSAWMSVRSNWLPVYLYTGTTSDGGNRMNFSYLGWNYHVLNYWLGRIFEHYEEIPYKKRIPVWKIDKFLKVNSIESDLAIVEIINRIAERRVRKVSGFIIPRWLKSYLDVDLTLSLIKKRGDITRRIRKYSLQVEMTNSHQEFGFFYERMHKPYVESRHKGSAYIEDYKKMLHDFKRKNSTLYFIILDGSRVAGLYEQNPHGIPYMYGVGVLDGSYDLMRKGVIGALYYFALEDHRENGIKRVNVGGTSPLLKDGLTEFKLRLGAKASEFQYQDSIRIKMLPLGNPPAVKEFLASNPFTYIEDKNIYCAFFKENTNEESEIEFQKLHKKSASMGFKETRAFSFNTEGGYSECSPGT